MADCAERFFAAENFFAREAEILCPVVSHLLLFLVERLHARLCDAHQALVFGGGEFHEEVVDRVDAHAVQPHLVVEVGRERKARVAREGDDLAAAHALALADVDLREVAVRGFVAVAVVDHDRLPRRGVAQRHVAHHAVGRGEDARPLGDGIVHALVRLQGLVEGVYAHAVRGREQRQLLVYHGLDGRDVVAAAARRVDERLQVEVRGVQLVEPLLHVGDPFAQFELEPPRRTVEDVFVGDGLPAFVFRIEVVGIRFEEDAEDVAVALGEVVHDGRQRVVPLGEGGVFAAQAVG